jgi:hypothetical protein
MNKEYSIAVWDVEFYKVDEDGNELLNEDGSVKLFCENTNFDYSYLADYIDPDDLVAVTS